MPTQSRGQATQLGVSWDTSLLGVPPIGSLMSRQTPDRNQVSLLGFSSGTGPRSGTGTLRIVSYPFDRRGGSLVGRPSGLIQAKLFLPRPQSGRRIWGSVSPYAEAPMRDSKSMRLSE